MTVQIELVSPCELLDVNGLDVMISRIHMPKSEEQFHILFLNELDTICPMNNEKWLKRFELETPTIIAAVGVCLVIPGIIMCNYLLYERIA